jgi:hypothetical protein
MMTELTPYVFSEHAPRNARCAIVFSASGDPVYRNIHRNRHGQPELILEAFDVETIRIDVAQRLEDGETIVEAQCNSAYCTADVNYTATSIMLTIQCPQSVNQGEGSVLVGIRLSTRETITFRLFVRLPDREFQAPRLSLPTFTRGNV